VLLLAKTVQEERHILDVCSASWTELSFFGTVQPLLLDKPVFQNSDSVRVFLGNATIIPEGSSPSASILQL
jgi:hypothetical protein